LKKIISTTAAILIVIPKRPNVNGPGGMFFLPVKMFGAMASTNDDVLRIIKDPNKSVNAVSLPSGMAPSAVPKTAQNSVAGIGQLSLSSTCEKNFAKGVALSRARVHQMRAMVRMVPITQIRREQKMMKRRPKVAPSLLVAWA
jgi:hypothetical protein